METTQVKRPKSGYIFFTLDARARVKAENPALKNTELMSRLGQLWKGMSEADKAPYEKKAQAEKDAYQAAKSAGTVAGNVPKPKKVSKKAVVEEAPVAPAPVAPAPAKKAPAKKAAAAVSVAPVEVPAQPAPVVKGGKKKASA